ncbi:uncharacterized protein VTP21DRAFT_7178 [Calcarisporiella thermophila]|uniref:uncharacterized protein n=1 Tax=Calcarisporiella thermophila TaxID=911321 RepID=UPI003743D6BE
MFIPRVIATKPKQSTPERGLIKRSRSEDFGEADLKRQKSESLEGDLRLSNKSFEQLNVINADCSLTVPLQDLGDIKVEEKTDDLIVEKSANQRKPIPGEPICIVCGKYGEYICDETNHDICSLECKAKDIELSQKTAETPPKSKILSCLPTPSERNMITLPKSHPASHRLIANLAMQTQSTLFQSIHDSQSRLLRSRYSLTVEGNSIPRPIEKFEYIEFEPKLLENMRAIGFIKPTPIQMQSTSAGICGRDLLVISPSGSGKTVAYLISTVFHVFSLSRIYNNRAAGPFALILAPTREQCVGIEELAKQMIIGLPNMRTALLVGGIPIPNQLHRLRQGAQILIATPGRFMELLLKYRENVPLDKLHCVVVDEADTMLSKEFDSQAKRIFNMLPPADRQMSIFATSLTQRVLSFANTTLLHPIKITMGGRRVASEIRVRQTLLWVENASKKKRLFDILLDSKYYHPPIIIFVEAKLGASMLAAAVRKKCGLDAVSYHGEEPMTERKELFSGFHSGIYPIMISTGALLRGISLPQISMVINFDMAGSVEEYFNQVGFAGINGVNTECQSNKIHEGWAITFINNDHKHLFSRLLKSLETLPANRITPLPPELTRNQVL